MGTMTLKIYKSVRKAFPVTVLKLEKHPPVMGAELQTLRCTGCQQELGDRPWAIAWIDDGKEKRSARICEDCIKDAEASSEPVPVLGTVTEAELKASLVAIHYHASRLYNMLDNKLIEQKCIVHSIVKECEDRIPELKKDKR